MSNQLTEDEIDYEVDEMPEGYEPTLSGSIPVTKAGNLVYFIIGRYTFSSNEESSYITEHLPDGSVKTVCESHNDSKEYHRAYAIKYLKYLINDQGLTASE